MTSPLTDEEKNQLIIKQMKRETEELKADSARMERVLSTVNIPTGLSNEALLYAENLVKVCEALDVKTPDEVNMIIGISDLHHELETAKEMSGASQRRIEKYKEELPVVIQKWEKWRKILERLDAQQEAKERESSKVTKSTLYMTKKKEQYEREVETAKQNLASAGYEQSLSHEELEKLGSEVKIMEERLKPLRLQLSSYKDLPPDVIQAQIKLEEKRLEVKKIEKEVADKLGEISIMR